MTMSTQAKPQNDDGAKEEEYEGTVLFTGCTDFSIVSDASSPATRHPFRSVRH